MLKKLLFGGESGLSVQANAGLALLRIFAGVALCLAHGVGKVPPSPNFVERTGEMGFPFPTFFSWMAVVAEVFGGSMLALGLFTRIASFLIACTMLTALIGVHWNDPFARKELALLFFFISLLYLLMGSADWSIDRFLRKKA